MNNFSPATLTSQADLLPGIDNQAFSDYALQLRKKFPLNNKVLLVQTLQLQLDAFNVDVARNRGYYAYPPTGLQCLAKAISGRGLEVEILDLNYQLLKHVIEDRSFRVDNWLNILDEALISFNPSIVGVTCIGVSTDLFNPNHPLTAVLKRIKQNEKHIVIAGGPVATNEFEKYLRNEICHFVVEGEGENKINFLFDQLYGKATSFPPTPGIYFYNQGKLQESQGEVDKITLSGNLVETYHLVPIEEYNKVGSLNPFSRMSGQDKHFSCIQLNRGCRANCKFCGVPKFMGRGVRQFPYQDVIDEVLYLIKDRGVRHFELLDDDFLGPANLRVGIAEFLSEMSAIRKKYDITWSAGNGLIAATITEDLMKLIHDSGCIGFRIGIESGNEEMLKRMRKPASKNSLRKFAQLLKPYPNIFVCGNYILGLFGDETFSQMLDSFNFSCELDVDWSSYSTYQFTSKKTTKVEKLQDDGKGATEFVPSKDSATREVKESQGILVGADVFLLPKDVVPSREQVKEIWFVFNLLSNYLKNKHLRSGGQPQKLLSWLDAIQVTYPMNPYMPLFSGLCAVLLNNKKIAHEYLKISKKNLSDSKYWQERFDQFSLTEIVNNFPDTEHEVYTLLTSIGAKFAYNDN